MKQNSTTRHTASVIPTLGAAAAPSKLTVFYTNLLTTLVSKFLNTLFTRRDSHSSGSSNSSSRISRTRSSKLFTAVFMALLTVISTSGKASASEDKECWRSYLLKVTTNTLFTYQASTPSRHSMSGYLSIRPLQDKPDIPNHRLWGLQLHQVQQKGNGTELPEETFLELPYAISVSNTGTINQFYFPSPLTADQKERLKGLAYYFQTIKEAPFKTVIKTETDTVGQYKAIYTNEGKRIKKTKENYTFAHKDNMANPVDQIEILNSSSLIDVDHCGITNISGNESLALSNKSKSFSMTIDQQFRFDQTPKKLSPLLWELPSFYSQWRIKPDQGKQLTQQELKALKAKFASELKSLKLLEVRPGELSKWLEKFNPVLDTLSPLLKSGQLNDEEQMRLFAALGLVDSPESFQLLNLLISDIELDETNRFRAMRALASGTSPLSTKQGDELSTLLNLDEGFGSESLQGAAIMTVGAVIGRREFNDTSQMLLENIQNHLSPNITPNMQAALIASLGNSHHISVIESIETYANSKHERVRANVASSLGQIGGEQAKRTLGHMLNTEEHDRAQQAILGALSQYELATNLIDRAANIGKASKSERTRKQAIKLLSQQTHEANYVQEHLRSMMKSESSRSNFTLAAKALTALNKKPSDQ